VAGGTLVGVPHVHQRDDGKKAIAGGGLITLLFVIEKALGIAPAPPPIHGEEAP
jgi:hypothetical protein